VSGGSSDLVALTLPILGVAVGSGATLLGQWITARTSRMAGLAQLQREDRLERKTAILRLLDATQRIEEHLDVARDGGSIEKDSADHDLHVMWLAVKEVVITCSEAMAVAADAYCTVLNDQTRSGMLDRAPKKAARQDLLDKAKAELKIT
jgi:hypothetical protein